MEDSLATISGTQDFAAAFAQNLGHMFSWAFVFPCLPRHSPYAREKEKQRSKGLGMQTWALGSRGEGMRQGNCFPPQSPVLVSKKPTLSPCSGWYLPCWSRFPHLSKLTTEDPVSTKHWSFQQILTGKARVIYYSPFNPTECTENFQTVRHSSEKRDPLISLALSKITMTSRWLGYQDVFVPCQ